MDAPQNAAAASSLIDAICLLNRHILAHDTATAALASWCEAHGIGDGPIRTVVLQHVQSSHGRCSIGHRRVNLFRGRVFLSAAEIRYRRDRLNETMTRQLEGSAVPFGQLIAPLAPRRNTTLTRFLDSNPTEGILVHHATVLDQSGCPIARVRETYQSALLA